MDILLEARPYVASAREAFESWATIGPNVLPPHPIDAMQVRLMRWQRENFSKVTTMEKHDLQMTLGVIEEFGEMDETKLIHGKHGKLDALGDIEVYTGQLCISYRLGIRSVMEYADVLFDRFTDEDGANLIPSALSTVGKLAHITLKRDQKIRGYDSDDKFMPAFVAGTASVMALAMLDIWCIGDDPEYNADDEPTGMNVKWDGLLTSTYIDVGEMVLSRNWNVDKQAGQTG